MQYFSGRNFATNSDAQKQFSVNVRSDGLVNHGQPVRPEPPAGVDEPAGLLLLHGEQRSRRSKCGRLTQRHPDCDEQHGEIARPVARILIVRLKRFQPRPPGHFPGLRRVETQIYLAPFLIRKSLVPTKQTNWRRKISIENNLCYSLFYECCDFFQNRLWQFCFRQEASAADTHQRLLEEAEANAGQQQLNYTHEGALLNERCFSKALTRRDFLCR